MMQNIHNLPSYDPDTTRALVDGAEVRYNVIFHANGDSSNCFVSCAVYHAGESGAVATSSAAYMPDGARTFRS